MYLRVQHDEAFLGLHMFCNVSFGFVPQPGIRYLVRYAADEDHCTASILNEATSETVPSFTRQTCQVNQSQ